MRRSLALVSITGLAALSSAAVATAQGPPGGGAPRFELGVYAGGAYSSEWYESRLASSNNGTVTIADDGEGFGIGITPAFGGMASLYLSPRVGLRVHYGYIPSRLPQADDGDLQEGDDDLTLNNHLYDLSLVFRPWVARSGGLLAQTYLFLGGGGYTADVASEGPADDANDGVVCEAFTLAQGACLTLEPRAATVGKGTLGLGFDLFPGTSGLGIFAELAAHVYDSPVHVGSGFVPEITVRPGQQFAVADDRYVVAPRLVLGLKLGLGGSAPMVAPSPRTAAPPPPAPPPPLTSATRDITVCVVTPTGLQNVTATYDPATGDTMVMGQRFSTRFRTAAPTYAAGAAWLINNETVQMSGREYVRYGTARMLTGVDGLTRVGEYQGTGVYAETGATMPHGVLYVPLRPGCEFQPYQLREQLRPRG